MVTVLFVVKFVSLATAGALGLSGLIHSYKDKNDKLTKSGKWAFSGILIASLLSGLILCLEQYQAIASANESARSLAESARKQAEISANLEKTLIGQNETLETTKEISSEMKQSLSDQQKLLKGSESLLIRTGNIQDEQSNVLTQQKKLFVKQDTVLNNLTGGDSFCYVSPSIKNDDLALALSSKGEFPLYDIQIEIIDLNEQKAVATYEQRTISTTTLAKAFGQMSLRGVTKKSFLLNIRTRYAIFREDLRLAKVGDVWANAYRVEKTAEVVPEKIHAVQETPVQRPRPARPGEITELNLPRLSFRSFERLTIIPIGIPTQPTFLLIEISSNYPLNESGYVDW